MHRNEHMEFQKPAAKWPYMHRSIGCAVVGKNQGNIILIGKRSAGYYVK
ncbi:Hypothetical protein OINT_1000141 [Brucella intermedia LMG 3301]|uniref:Uncharacterized protein n=1 Tax=Brucella intermedia LMG 3301 TaxID=641118 RepID=C4WGU3_9HYPH|nr:Hypothetical protein OINT_1000141 [Brucella intermedia LMG 3301]